MVRRIEENEVSTLVQYFSQLPDPRVENRCEHLLLDILVMTICAVLCGARTCTDFEDFGISKEQWLRKFLKLPGGIPSHDTFRRVLSIVDPSEMEKYFFKWVESILGDRKLERISLDGKSMGGSPQGGIAGRKALHLVNVYSHEYSICLGQVESNGSGGESTAALELLDGLDIKDTLVMADAGFAVRSVVSKIREKKGHYLVALKNNNRFYRDRVEAFFDKSLGTKSKKVKERGHGRDELRIATVLKASPRDLDPKFFDQWPDLQTLIRIDRTRVFEDKRPMLQLKDRQSGKIKYVRHAGITPEKIMRTTEDTVYYLTSKKMNAEEALNEVRKHWGIENGLHWVLDVTFGEDDWVARAKRLSRNLASIRKIGLNLIRSNTSLPKKSIRRHMKIAGWSDEALEKLVFGANFDA